MQPTRLTIAILGFQLTATAISSTHCRPRQWPIWIRARILHLSVEYRSLSMKRRPTSGINVILEGEVKLSINSSDGRRLSFHIAKAGEVLGLSSTLSGGAYEMTADTLYPAKIAHISRQVFLQFLSRHPDAYQIVTREISRSFNLACEQLRMVGLSSSVPERLARLLLVWSDEPGQKPSAARAAASRSLTKRSANSLARRARPSRAPSATSKIATSWRSTDARSPFPAAWLLRATRAAKTQSSLDGRSLGTAVWKASWNSGGRPIFWRA